MPFVCLERVYQASPLFSYHLALVFFFSLLFIDHYLTQTTSAICKRLGSAFKYQ